MSNITIKVNLEGLRYLDVVLKELLRIKELYPDVIANIEVGIKG